MDMTFFLGVIHTDIYILYFNFVASFMSILYLKNADKFYLHNSNNPGPGIPMSCDIVFFLCVLKCLR